MKIYEAQLKYSLVGEVKTEALDECEKVYHYIKDAYELNPMQESIWVICFASNLRPISRTRVTVGIANACMVHPREVFRIAVLSNAISFALSHNHPSGDPTPSKMDIEMTRIMREAAETMKIDLVDHIICGDSASDPNGQGYYSFSEAGFL